MQRLYVLSVLIRMMEQSFTIAVLVSGSGSNLQALLNDQQGYRVGLILADRVDAGAIERGLAVRVATCCVPLHHPKDRDVREGWERQVAGVMDTFAPDLIVMAGWMRVMSAWFVERYRARMINLHPALLPDDAGDSYTLSDGRVIPAIRGAHAVRDALRLNLPMTGCTVHWVTPEVDAGPALARAEVPILPDDDEATLHERIKREERRLIVATVRRVAGARQGDRATGRQGAR